MKKIIISQSILSLTSRSELRDSLDQRFADLFGCLGYLIFPVPNNLGANLPSYINHIRPDYVVLSGGNNIGDYPQRDSTESYLIGYCVDHEIPLLGICRGMQMIGTYFGAELISCNSHCSTSHQLQGLFTHRVNSYHNYSLKQSPANFKIIATSPDHTIEAIRHLNLPIEAWMWHPERECPYNPIDLHNIQGLFS